MYIYELEKEEVVTLTIKMKERDKMEWKCPVLDTSVKGKCILVPPLKYEDKVLTFGSEGIIAEVVAVRDGKPVIFKGCHVQYIKFKDQRYHAIIAKENGVQGRVTLQFTVNVDGSVTNVKVLRGVDSSLDKEAVRVVSNSPKWTPGKQRDRAVKVTYTFPVIFQLR